MEVYDGCYMEHPGCQSSQWHYALCFYISIDSTKLGALFILVISSNLKAHIHDNDHVPHSRVELTAPKICLLSTMVGVKLTTVREWIVSCSHLPTCPKT